MSLGNGRPAGRPVSILVSLSLSGCGSDAYAHYIPAQDASSVQEVREPALDLPEAPEGSRDGGRPPAPGKHRTAARRPPDPALLHRRGAGGQPRRPTHMDRCAVHGRRSRPAGRQRSHHLHQRPRGLDGYQRTPRRPGPPLHEARHVIPQPAHTRGDDRAHRRRRRGARRLLLHVRHTHTGQHHPPHRHPGPPLPPRSGGLVWS